MSRRFLLAPESCLVADNGLFLAQLARLLAATIVRAVNDRRRRRPDRTSPAVLAPAHLQARARPYGRPRHPEQHKRGTTEDSCPTQSAAERSHSFQGQEASRRPYHACQYRRAIGRSFGTEEEAQESPPRRGCRRRERSRVKCEKRICFIGWMSERERNIPTERATVSSEKRRDIADIRLRRLLIAPPCSVCVTAVSSCRRARGSVAEDGGHVSLIVPGGATE